MAKTQKPSSKKIIDVTQPGKSAPSDNSKSVIVNSRKIIKDPMVVEDSLEKENKAADKDLSKKPTAAVVKPLSAPELESVEEPEAPAKPEVKEKPEPKEAAKPAKESESKPAKTEEDDAQLAPKDIEKADKAEAAEKSKHDKEIQALIDSKKYYLPINSVEKRRSKRVVVLGVVLSLLLIIVWIDIALDAGLIQIDNIKPVTHFFSN